MHFETLVIQCTAFLLLISVTTSSGIATYICCVAHQQAWSSTECQNNWNLVLSIHKHTETSTSLHLLPPYKSCSSESLLAWTRCQRLSMYSNILYSYSFPIFWGFFLGASSKMLQLKQSSNHRNNHPNIGDLYVYCAMGAYREGVAFTLSAIDPTFSPPCNCHGRQEVGDSMSD